MVLAWTLMSCTMALPALQPANTQKATADLQTAIAVIQTATAQAASGTLPTVILTIGTVAPPVGTVAPVGCVDNALFVGDVTVPDNTVFNPGDRFDKTWRLRNAGTCAWGAGYRLVFLSGNLMGALNSVGVPLTNPDNSADRTVAMTAPASPAVYSGVWQMMNASGQRFGPKFTTVIQVPAPAPPPVPPSATFTVPPPPPLATATNTPPAPLAVKVEITADETAINAKECTYIRGYVEGASAAWLDGEPVVAGYAEKKVCPCVNKTYELKANLLNGEVRTRTVTINVTGSCVAPLVTLAKPPLLLMTLAPAKPFPFPLLTVGP
jgi:hypothetical protein